MLLKNAGVLPLALGKKIAVVGPHANATTALVGNYLGQICPSNGFECIVSPFQAIADINGRENTVLAALPSLTKNNSDAWTAALAAAAAADTVVILLGLDGSLEGESNDRTSIDLPALQHAFASAVASLGKDTVVVLIHGGAVDTTAERDSAGIGAMIDAFYPGFVGSNAIATTLFGENDYLGGKMAFTTYPASYVNAINMSEMELDVGPGRGYRFYTGEPVFKFGHGLSLTSFALSKTSGPNDSFLNTESTPSTVLTFTISVSNTGARTGDDVIQAYFIPVTTPSQPNSRLLKQLFDFQRVHVAAGASTQVTFNVSSETLRLTDKASGNSVSTPGAFTISIEDGVATPLTYSVSVAGAEVVAAVFPY